MSASGPPRNRSSGSNCCRRGPRRGVMSEFSTQGRLSEEWFDDPKRPSPCPLPEYRERVLKALIKLAGLSYQGCGPYTVSAGLTREVVQQRGVEIGPASLQAVFEAGRPDGAGHLIADEVVVQNGQSAGPCSRAGQRVLEDRCDPHGLSRKVSGMPRLRQIRLAA